jgi:hypothetical protein
MNISIATFRTRLGYMLHVAIVVTCSIAAYHVGPDILKAVVAFPGAVSLASIPWQLFRDQRAHERAIELADRNSAIALGVDSPMAKAAFDNYVTFASEYSDEMAKIVSDLVKEGPRPTHISLSRRLFSIRRKHALWITQSTDDVLFKMEDAIWKMAVDAGFTEASANHDIEWKSRYEAAHKKWSELLGIKFHPIFPELTQPSEADVETNLQQMVLKHLRQILGTENYSAMRDLAISRALGTK